MLNPPVLLPSPQPLSSVRKALRRLRCIILPPRNGVFLAGRWHYAVPFRAGPPVASWKGEALPEWWVLDCGRRADFVGIHDGRPLPFRQPPTRPGEILIGAGIYKVSLQPANSDDRDAA